jgi:hypothetical protein
MSARRIPAYAAPVTLLVAALAVVYGRFLVEGRGAVQAARVAAANGDRAEATRCYLDALRAYVPGSPFERQALDGLEALAGDAVRAGDREGERRAFQAIRAGLLGTRSTFVPYRSRLWQAEQRLIALDTVLAFPPADPGIPIERGGTPFLGRLHTRGPAVLWTLVSLSGFAIWVGAVVALIRRGLERGAPSPSPSRFDLGLLARVLLPALFVLGFGLFLVGLRFA